MNKSANILILVPIDFSEHSFVTLEQAHNLAYYYGGELMLIHVFEHSGILTKLFSNESANYILKKRVKDDLDKLAEKTSAKKGIRTHSMLAEGVVWEEILNASERLKPTLIVMSALQSKGLKRRFIANNTLRVVKEAPCPLISIRGKQHREGCKNIVTPLDLTKTSRQKVKNVIKFAKLFEGTTVHLVSIIDVSLIKRVDSILSQLNDVKCEIETEGINCHAELVKIIRPVDSIANAVIAYSEHVQADVIMIMTQQEKNPTEFFIGSSATAIINRSEIPVMSITPERSLKGQFF